MVSPAEQIDLLDQLVLPDRYETLVDRLGPQLAQVLVPPSEELRASLRRLVDSIRSRREGLFVPLHGASGAGKTTFASNVHVWEPAALAPTLSFEGELKFNELTEAVKRHRENLTANDRRLIPINVDHRENDPPNDQELSTIKRFLRTSPAGVPCLLLWPEVNLDTARQIAARYSDLAGALPLPLPLEIAGPDRDAWQDIAKSTLALSNDMEGLASIGVDPADYDPQEFRTLGEFLRQLSSDFKKILFDLRASLEKPVKIVIVFVSESSDPGVLTQLVHGTRYGLLDPGALLAVTRDSVIGKWWSSRRGLLTRTIFQLNAHALSLGPTASVSVIRNCGPVNDEILDSLGIVRAGASRAVRDLSRTDLGKLLLAKKLDRFESRGTPADQSTAAFQLIAERGFNLGKDKKLNEIMSVAMSHLLKSEEIPFRAITFEQKLDFCPLIPDNGIDFGDSVLCIEYTWRKGDFLSSGNRSAVAQYILGKLKNYARELGWHQD